uniref:WLM domain-containing protein n=1 Tax=Globisporangium ultimum (strain ATCC 200006 / CBS 805.95 / DAOM BR144) TaxID=431595 RepID=K3WLY5_GLOUD
MAMMQGGGAESFAIGKVRALVRRPRRDDAQKLLEQIAAHVLPILTQRCFRVRRLQEFFPTNPHLLGMNVNKGVKIYIRLRPANAPGTFFPFEALLETMLHELTHMVRVGIEWQEHVY